MLLPSHCAHSRAELVMGTLPLGPCIDVHVLKRLLHIVKSPSMLMGSGCKHFWCCLVNKQRCWEMGKLMLWLTAARFPWYPTNLEHRRGIETVPVLAVVNTPWVFWGSCMTTVSACCQRATLFPHDVAPKTDFKQLMLDFPWTHFYTGQREVLCIASDWETTLCWSSRKCHDWCAHSFSSSEGRLAALCCEMAGDTSHVPP